MVGLSSFAVEIAKLLRSRYLEHLPDSETERRKHEKYKPDAASQRKEEHAKSACSRRAIALE